MYDVSPDRRSSGDFAPRVACDGTITRPRHTPPVPYTWTSDVPSKLNRYQGLTLAVSVPARGCPRASTRPASSMSRTAHCPVVPSTPSSTARMLAKPKEFRRSGEERRHPAAMSAPTCCQVGMDVAYHDVLTAPAETAEATAPSPGGAERSGHLETAMFRLVTMAPLRLGSRCALSRLTAP